MKLISTFILLTFLVACAENTPKKHKKNKHIIKANSAQTSELDTTENGSKKNFINFDKGKVQKQKKLKNGITLKWIERGDGPSFKRGDMALIDYRLGTPDGKIIDGNNRINLPFIPFVIGYSMQTPGWDLAFEHLNVGDFVKIEIPASLAYGAKGIKDIIAPNTPNWLYVKIISKIKPSIDLNGIRSWKLADGKPFELEPGGVKEVAYEFVASTPNRMNAIVAKKFPQRFVAGQKNAVPGLRKILKNALEGERYYLVLQPEQAYGIKGYGDAIGPNEPVFFLVDIVGVRSIS
jgi:FKBP-type peptidyl-prolyl cis-trans isomerase